MKQTHLLSTLWFILCATSIFGQTILFSPVKKNALAENATTLDAHIKKYTLFQPDQIVWSNLLAERPQSLTLTLPFEGGLTLELERTNPLAHDFILTASNANGGTDTLGYDPGLHYSGKIVGESQSLVAISIFDDQMMGVISDGNSNINLGRVNTDAARAANLYAMYRDVDLIEPRIFSCGAEDVDDAILLPIANKIESLSENLCSARIFFDCDQTMYSANGSNTTQTANYLISLFNVVKTIYTNENVGIEISEVHVWTTLDPFRNDTRENALDDFTGYYRANGFNGHFAHLASVTQITGLAWINSSYNNALQFGFDGWLGGAPSYPSYSYSVQVIAHELGHNLGSRHTQWCGWPGGVIDNCAAPEGSCALGPPPVNGGTIMSYCGPYPLSNGFGPLPGNVIRNFYNSYNDVICGGLEYSIIAHEGYRMRNGSEIPEMLQFQDCEPVWFYWSVKGARSEIKVDLKYHDGTIQSQNYSAANSTLDLTWHRGHFLRNGLPVGAYNLKLSQKSGNNFVLISEKNFTVVSTPSGNNCGEKLRLPFNYSISDASGSNNSPIAQGGSPVYDKDRFNSCNGAIRITGGTYLEAPVINERAVSFWFKLNQQAQMVIYDGGPNGIESKDFKIGVYKPDGLWGNASFDNTFGLFFTTWDRDIAIPFDALKSGWHHVAVSRDALGENRFRIMIDGQTPSGYVWDGVVFVQTWTAQSQPFTFPAGGYGVPNLFVPTYKTYLGRDIQLTIEYFDGWLDDVRVFSQLLDQNEMLALYNVVKDDPTNLSASSAQPTYCEGQTIQLNATATAASSYIWAGPGNFSSNLQNPTRTNVTTAMSGTYTVTVTVNGGCTSTKTVSITVGSKPVPVLSITNTCMGMNNGKITATTSGGTNFSYLWNNGQIGSTANNLTVGTYTVTVTNIGTGCTASASAAVSQASNLTLNVLNSISPCNNASNGSISVSASGASGPFTYQWNNGLSGATISNLATGTYTVTVSAIGACAATSTVSLLPILPPTPNFSAAPNVLNVNFTNTSQNATTYSWNFGDGSTSTLANPLHNYSNTGIYQVCLTATNTCGSATGCTGVSVSTTPEAHLDVQNGFNPVALVQTLFNGSCVAVTNVSFTGNNIQMAKFFGGMTSVGIDNGIILSTGNALDAEGPNDSQGTGTNTTGTTSDPDFSLINSGESIWDMASLEFDFVASVPNIQFDFVFASEEYCEYTQSQFRDACLFLVSGPGINGGFSNGAGNFAVLPGTNTPISVSTINHEINSGYYISNLLANPSLPCIGIPAYGLGPVETQFDGLTKKIKTNLSLQLGQTYHAKIKIADSGDGIFDSAIFVQAGAFNTQSPTVSVSSLPACTNQSNGSATVNATGGATPYTYLWSNNQTTTTASNLAAGTYTVTVSGANGCAVTATAVVQSLQNSITTPTPNGTDTPTPNSTVTYTIVPVANATTYTWMPPAGCSINGNPIGQAVILPAASGTSVSVTFGCGWGTLCVEAKGDCIQSAPVCKNLVYFGEQYKGFDVCASPPGADAFEDACIYASVNGVMGSNIGYTYTDLPINFCAPTVESGVWYGFVATNASMTFMATPTSSENGNGIQLALTDANQNTLDCDGGANLNYPNPISVSYTTLIPGEVYFLFIDGYAGDECNFTITSTPSVNGFTLPTLGAISPIQGPPSICPGGSLILKVPPVTNALQYTWQASPGTLINGNPGPLTLGASGHTVTVTLANATSNITVQASNGCQQSNLVQKIVMVQPIPVTTLPPAIVCNEDVPYMTPWGDAVFATGTYTTIMNSYLNCDSIVRQLVTIKPPIFKTLPIQAVCEGDYVSICGEIYGSSGFYSVACESYQGCDSIVNFNLVVLDPIAEITGSTTICGGASITLGSTPSIGTKTWKNGNGQVVGSGASLVVTQPGVYILTNVQMMSGVTCINYDTTLVTQSNTLPPTVTAFGGNVDCANPTLTIGASSPNQGVIYSWFSQNGFIAAQQFVNVSSAGIYTVIVTDITGCTASSTATVNNNGLGLALQTITEPNGLTCQSTAIPSTGTPPYQYTWTNNQTTQTATNLPSGQFVVTVIDATGCTATQLDSCMPVGTDDIEGLEVFSVRPNPASTNLSVHIRLSSPENIQIQLINAIGQKLFESTHNTHDVEENIGLLGFPSGCYFLQVSTQFGIKSEIISIIR